MQRMMLIAGLVVVAIACSGGADMLGEMLDASVPDAGAQDTPVQCNKSMVDTGNPGNEGIVTITQRWAEFSVTPGVTEVTTCGRFASGRPPWGNDVFCFRNKARWKEGTSTGFVECGRDFDYADPETPDFIGPDPVSITVHD